MVSGRRAGAMALALAGLGVLAAEAPIPPQEHVRDYESSRQRNVIPDPDIPVEVPNGETTAAAPPWQAAEDALWVLLREGDLDRLDAGIARLAAEHPRWRPPARLLELAAEARTRQQIAAALAAGDDRKLLALGESVPAYFGCGELGNAWARAEALGRLEGPDREAAAYRELLSRCGGRSARMANLAKLRPLVPPAEFLPALEGVGAADPGLAAQAGYRDLDREVRREVAAARATEGDYRAVAQVLAPARDGILRGRDAEAAALLAWAYAELGDAAEALAWEERLAGWGVSRGDALARARLAAGDEAGALAAAEAAAAADPAAARLAHGLRSARAARANDCRRVLEELAAAARWAPLSVDGRRLEAWALRDCGRLDEAAGAFADLYRATGADEDARGLLLTDWERRAIPHSENLAAEAGGPLAARLPAEPLPVRDGGVDYRRLVLEDDGRVRVVHRRGGSAWGGAAFQTRQGDGPGRLDAWRAPLLRAGFDRDAQGWRLDLDRIDLAADAPRPGDWPLAPGVDALPRMTGSTDGLEGGIAWRRDAAFAAEPVDLEAAVGFTPTNQPISPTLTGRLAVSAGAGDQGWAAALERAPVRESLTSWAGTGGAIALGGATVRLPFDWGRVTRTGLSVSGYTRIDELWQAAGSARAGIYAGQNVPDNTGGEVYAELTRTFAEEGDWRFAAGPWLYASAFEENLGHFSPGHGGYFSPAWLGQGGLSLRALGAGQDGDWYVDARLDLGWQRHEEDAADLIPDPGLERRFLAATGLAAADLGSYAATTRHGFAGGIDVEGMRRVGAGPWHVGGLVSLRAAPQYDEATAMVVVRYGTRPSPTAQSGEFRRLFLDRRR